MISFGKIVVLLCLTFILHADHCFYGPRLLNSFHTHDNPMTSLYLVAKTGDKQATKQLLKLAVSLNSPYWLNKSAMLANSEDIYQVAIASKNLSIQEELLTFASEKGHALSQYRLAGLTKTPSRRLNLMHQAAEQGHDRASLALFVHYSESNQETKAKKWGEVASFTFPHAAIQMAKSFWQMGEVEHASQMLKRAKENNDPKSAQLLNLISQYSPNNIIDPQASLALNCAVNIQLVAATLPAMTQVYKLLDSYSQDKRLAELPICFNLPVWLEANKMNCTGDDNKRLQCSLSALIELSEQRSFTHAVVVAEKGVANVNNGIMYLDEKDDYQVFVHELAHFAGFVDEYRVNETIANNFCRRKSAPNLVFAKHLPNIQTTHFAQYKSAFPQLRLTSTDTCDSTEFQAFKPTAEMTFLEQHEIGVIPDIYLRIWENVLNNRYALTPAFVNFAQYYESKGQTEQANKWWKRYRQFRQFPDA